MPETEYTVGAAADASAVSVRTLHHYDEIGLLSPSRRNSSGYRIYSAADLDRLQRIVFYRELGLDLADIAQILSDESTTDEDHLRRQHELVSERITRFQAMLALIDQELAARSAGITLTPAQRKEIAERLVGADARQPSTRGPLQEVERHALPILRRASGHVRRAGLPSPRSRDRMQQQGPPRTGGIRRPCGH